MLHNTLNNLRDILNVSTESLKTKNKSKQVSSDGQLASDESIPVTAFSPQSLSNDNFSSSQDNLQTIEEPPRQQTHKIVVQDFSTENTIRTTDNPMPRRASVYAVSEHDYDETTVDLAGDDTDKVVPHAAVFTEDADTTHGNTTENCFEMEEDLMLEPLMREKTRAAEWGYTFEEWCAIKKGQGDEIDLIENNR